MAPQLEMSELPHQTYALELARNLHDRRDAGHYFTD